MPSLYTIACDFQIEQSGPIHHGIAICSDPDTPIVFVFESGEVYLGKEIWTYKLRHFQPWMYHECGEDR